MTEQNKFAHLAALPQVLEVDLDYIDRKDRSYGASWKKRGGVGAFMMLVRKWDRLENMLANFESSKFDIFELIRYENGSDADGTALAEVRDLRRYLALVEAEMVARGVVQAVLVPVNETRIGRMVEQAKQLGITTFVDDAISPEEMQLVREHRDGKVVQRAMAADMRGRRAYRVGDPVFVSGQPGVVQPAKAGYSSDFVAVQPDNQVNTLVYHHSMVEPRFPSKSDDAASSAEPAPPAPATTVPAPGPGSASMSAHPDYPSWLKKNARVILTRNNVAGEVTLTGMVFPNLASGDDIEFRYGSGNITTAKLEELKPIASEPDRPGTPEDGGHHATACDLEEEPEAPTRYRRYLTNSEWHYHMRDTIKWGSLAGESIEHLYELVHDGVEDHYVGIVVAKYVEEYSL